MAECLFADPIADVAVFGCVDDQELPDEAKAYEALVEVRRPLSIADAPEKGQGWLLSLELKWFQCTVEYMKRMDGLLWITNLDQEIVSGMSGSPVLSDDGSAIGIVCLGSNLHVSKNPRLFRDLPGWLLRAQAKAEAPAKSFRSSERSRNQKDLSHG